MKAYSRSGIINRRCIAAKIIKTCASLRAPCSSSRLAAPYLVQASETYLFQPHGTS